MVQEFIGRYDELDLLNDSWESDKAQFIVLYGRRRIGKTRLLTHWMSQHRDDGIYWMAEPTSAVDQLRSFSQALANFEDPESTAPLDFTYANWEQALRQVALLAQGKRMALFIDEITYLMDIYPEIIGTLQKVWDHRLSKSNLLLTLSGSQMSLIQKKLLAYDAPLYGRSSANIKLKPLPFGITNQYFPNYNAYERVLVYTIWGGIPAYWERLNPNIPVIDNLYQQLRPSNAWMIDEPRLLLQDFLNDMNNYVGIMRAMSYGSHTLKEIGARNGLHSTHMSSYVSVLRTTEFVDRIVPVTQRGQKSRLGRYVVIDPYLRFYYRFLSSYQSKLAMGQQDELLQSIERNLPEFIEANTWRELSHEWLLRASMHNEIPLPIDAVGGEWKRNFDIDVVGISEEEHSLVLGTSLWRDGHADIDQIADLVRNTSNVISKADKWRIYYLGFSANGWTEDAHARADAVVKSEFKGRAKENWEYVGIRLLDLHDVDQDLARWTETI